MKKTFIFMLILAVLATASTTYAVVIGEKVRNVKKLSDANVETITSTLLSAAKKEVIKFKDGDTTCYITHNLTYPDGIGAISCVK